MSAGGGARPVDMWEHRVTVTLLPTAFLSAASNVQIGLIVKKRNKTERTKVIEGWPHPRDHSECFIFISSFNPYSSPVETIFNHFKKKKLK